MELRFIGLALKQRWWLVAVFALFGVFVASSLGGPGVARYESTAVLLVKPSSNAVSPALASQPDRYIRSQISILESSAMAESVADALGGDETALSTSRSIEFTQRDETDIVEVTATTTDADRSQRIAQGFAEAYLVEVASRTDGVFEPEQERLNGELAEVERELQEVNDALARAARPYIDSLTTDTPINPPAPSVLDPAAATRQSLLVEDLQRINAQLNTIELAARQSVESEIVQNAVVPSVPLGDGSGLLKLAALVIMPLLGAVIALATARFSATIIDDRDVEERLGQPIEARLPNVAGLVASHAAALEPTDKQWQRELDQLAGRIELASSVTGARIVAVGGSQLGSGSTTLAIGLAARFARRGNRTVLIDADSTRADLTAALQAPTDIHLADIAGQRPDALGRTNLENLITLGTTRNDLARRVDGRAIAEALRSAADVVIIDVGPVLHSMSASQLAQGVDQLVLTVPTRGQRHDGMDQVARVYHSIADRILPVMSDVGRSRRFPGSSAVPPKSGVGPTGQANTPRKLKEVA